MKNIFVLLIVIVLASCSKSESNSAMQADMFKSKIDNGATIIDVRTPAEYANGHIAGSQNINIKDDSFKETIAALDKTKSYAVYCASGVRSGKAAELMKEIGFTNVFTLEGGIKTWKDSGYALE